MDVFICPRDWAHSTSRFVPTHMVSLQNPNVSSSDLEGLRPVWISEENHYLDLFFDVDLPASPHAPPREKIAALIDWLAPRCGPDSGNRFLIHCDAGLGRSTAVGYIAWAIHLGPGNEAVAFDWMVKSALQRRLVPNSVIIAHADDVLGRRGALMKPLTEWNRRVPWRRTSR
ncbi:MAG: hypothetical protein MUF31_15755 [Akkermansiaceae bacterium]|jgi:predicted protein tyrosine phosphatase|nr:hypothetical protein [Akkermansiaceae bacterium]